MFAVFTLTSGKSVHVDTDAVLAVEQLDGGSRIHVGSGTLDVKEAVEAVLEALGGGDEEEDEDDD